ncbi:tetratricopeptide repeat protein [Thermocrinis sp.]|uniref:SPOR domain-containing protein n=1 Tax=Thermocrinis sp. TaxID=2024383 RepID=UPI002FDF048D
MKLLSAILILFIFSCASIQQEKDVKGWQYYYDLGVSSLLVKNYSEAITNFFLAAQMAPNEPKVWNSLGMAYMEVMEYDKAEKAFKRALEVDKKFTEAKLNLGILHFRKKDYERALKEIKETLDYEAFPNKHVAFYYLARIYKVLENQALYFENLKKATIYNPMFLDAQFELANAYQEIGDYRSALDVYRNLVSNGVNNPQIELNMAWLMFYLGDYENAKLYVRRIIENKQAEANLKTQAYNLLSQILIKEQERLISKAKAQEELTEKPDLSQNPQDLQKKDIPKEEPVAAKSPQGSQTPDKSTQPKEKVIRIQLGAFSSEDRAKAWKEKLEREKGVRDLVIVEQLGIYKVLYGNFKNRAEAKYHLEKLRTYNIYGFIVQE